MPRKLCLRAGCPRFAEVGARCRLHAAEQRKQNRSPNNSFYASRRWRLTRRRKLFQDPICEHPGCDRPAEHVHHITPIEDGGDRNDFANLQSLCKPHHSQLHREGREAA
jgi:5-methylcytosine-specific restriction enzyme A